MICGDLCGDCEWQALQSGAENMTIPLRICKGWHYVLMTNLFWTARGCKQHLSWTGMLTPASVLGSTVHVLQMEIYYSSQELHGLALLPHVFEHQSYSEPLYSWKSFECCFKRCLEFFTSLHSEVSFLTWHMIQASCIYNPCLVKHWHKSRRQEFLERGCRLPVWQQGGVPTLSCA